MTKQHDRCDRCYNRLALSEMGARRREPSSPQELREASWERQRAHSVTSVWGAAGKGRGQTPPASEEQGVEGSQEPGVSDPL